MRASRVYGLSARVALLLGGALAPAAGRAEPARTGSPAEETTTAGAWIWTRPDARLLEIARGAEPTLRAAVHVATIERRADGVHILRRALSPDVAGGGREVAVAVRFDDSIHADWSAGSEGDVVNAVAPLLSRILEEVDATGVRAHEIQLDYDAPVRALASWAALVRALANGPLRSREVWVTSLPAHLGVVDYGAMFAGAAVGHILQIFDTGLTCTTEHAATLGAELAAAGLRFRIGVGGFERAARPAAHECWRIEAASWRASRRARSLVSRLLRRSDRTSSTERSNARRCARGDRRAPRSGGGARRRRCDLRHAARAGGEVPCRSRPSDCGPRAAHRWERPPCAVPRVRGARGAPPEADSRCQRKRALAS